MTQPTVGPYEVHIPRAGIYGTGHCSVIARRPDNSDTVLLCEMNTTVRNPWRPPADIQVDARLLAKSWEMYQILKQLYEFPWRRPDGTHWDPDDGNAGEINGGDLVEAFPADKVRDILAFIEKIP